MSSPPFSNQHFVICLRVCNCSVFTILYSNIDFLRNFLLAANFTQLSIIISKLEHGTIHVGSTIDPQ